MPKKKKANLSIEKSYPILDTDGISTDGLKGQTKKAKKSLSQYSLQASKRSKSHLEQEKKRTAHIVALLEQLHSGSAAPEGENFTGFNFLNRDLERVRFTDNLMARCLFRKGALRDSHWENCDLSGADFRHADLRSCIFDGCNLTGADLRYANLEGARIIDSNLRATNFDQANLNSAAIENVLMEAQSFYNTSCQQLSLFNSTVSQAFMDHADFTDAKLSNVTLKNCTLTQTNFHGAHLMDCTFKCCDSYQEGPQFTDAHLINVIMEDCELAATNLTNSQLFQCSWDRVNIDSALFEKTLLTELDIKNSQIKNSYSLQSPPEFFHCLFEHSLIEQTDFDSATFNETIFKSVTIQDSDIESWSVINCTLDDGTVIEKLES